MRGNIRNNSDDILVHPDVTTYAMKNDACTKINKQCHFPTDKNRKRASMLKDLKLNQKTPYSYFVAIELNSRNVTWAGTPSASTCGIFLGSRKTWTWYRAVPDSAFAKKMFHTVNHQTFEQALFSILLRDMCPWIEENIIMMGGTKDRNNWRIRLGRYPVITWLMNVLQLRRLYELLLVLHKI